MIDIAKIINAIDDEILQTGKSFLTPIEANAMLEYKGLLKDSKRTPGLPIRNLCRKKRIPYAYQLKGKCTRWRIPYSSTKDVFVSKTENDKLPADKDVLTIENQIELAKKYNKARLNFKPENIDILLIAEAPPKDIKRFFYYPDVKERDSLFLGVMEVLYPEKKEEYIEKGRLTTLKLEMLRNFEKDGFYLLDLYEIPIQYYSGSLDSALKKLTQKIRSVADENVKIILIKANVYDDGYPALIKNGFKNVINKKIDFPSSGNQKKFREKFTEALRLAKYMH